MLGNPQSKINEGEDLRVIFHNHMKYTKHCLAVSSNFKMYT